MENIEAGQALLSYFGLSVNPEGVKLLGLNNVRGVEAYKNATVFSHLSDFFTSTIPEEAERIWNVVVSGITSLAKWVTEEATKLWNSAVDAVKSIVKAIGDFLKKFWNSVKEFVKRFQGATDNVKNHVADATLKVTDELRNVALGRIKYVLKEQGYDVEKMSEEELREHWKQYMNQHPLTPEEEAEANEMLNGDTQSKAVLQERGVRARWKVFIEAHPLTPEEEAQANDMLNGPSN